MRYAWIENGQVVNVIVWDGETELNLPENVTLIDTDEAGPGWTWDDGFIPPVFNAGND